MTGWERFFTTELPDGAELRETPLWLSARGALRLDTIARQLGGAAQAAALAKSLGRYELDEALLLRLRLDGLELAGGEIPALSPERWLESYPSAAKPLASVAAEWEEQGLLLVGVKLDPAERTRFLGFLRKLRPECELGPWEMAAVYEHFCFPRRRTMNLLAATRGRV